MTLEIRRARIDDAVGIADVHIAGWRWAYCGLLPDALLDNLPNLRDQRIASRRALIAGEDTHPRRTWVALLDGRIVGFAITVPSRDDDAAPHVGELGGLYLDPTVARQGIGRALTAHALDDLRARGYTEVTLWVLSGNHLGRGFYEATGWRPDGTEKVEELAGVEVPHTRYRSSLR